LQCQGLGGRLTPGLLESILGGRAIPGSADYDVIAQALNDSFVDRGQDHPVPYADDIGLEGAER
jgi:hypothetical protein